LQEAELCLEKFSWGNSFLELNKELLEEYIKYMNAKKMIAARDRFLENVQKKKTVIRSKPVLNDCL